MLLPREERLPPLWLGRSLVGFLFCATLLVLQFQPHSDLESHTLLRVHRNWQKCIHACKCIGPADGGNWEGGIPDEDVVTHALENRIAALRHELFDVTFYLPDIFVQFQLLELLGQSGFVEVETAINAGNLEGQKIVIARSVPGAEDLGHAFPGLLQATRRTVFFSSLPAYV